MKQLTKDTLVPLGFAVTVIGSGSAWMTTMQKAVGDQAKVIQEYKEQHTEQIRNLWKLLYEMNQKLSGIEGELKRIRR